MHLRKVYITFEERDFAKGDSNKIPCAVPRGLKYTGRYTFYFRDDVLERVQDSMTYETLVRNCITYVVE